MKKIIKRKLIKFLNKKGFVRNVNNGKDIYSKNNLLSNFFNILKDNNISLNTIVDVGANKGTWTRYAMNFFPKSNYILFEPQINLKDYMEDLLKLNNVNCHFCGVGSKNEVANFTYVERDDSCSFVHNEDYAISNNFKQEKLEIKTLNSTLGNNIPELIKIDAEGFDMKVLEGASDYIGKTEIFLVEVGVASRKIENSIENVVLFFKENNYKLFEITDLNRPFNNNILWLAEFAFVLKGGKVEKSLNIINDTSN
jgi:FkbM family methyltransferase